MWSLMCPNECPGLQDCWGEKFEELYVRYVLNAECAYFVCQFIKHLAINQKHVAIALQTPLEPKPKQWNFIKIGTC